MTLKEKIERECPTHIHLYREGIFWKLYNQSAFHFSQLIKPYQVKKKYMKTLNMEIVSIGFPQSVLTNALGRLRELSMSVEVGKHEIYIVLLEEQNGYDEWFQQFPLMEKANTSNLKTNTLNSVSSVSPSCSNEDAQKMISTLNSYLGITRHYHTYNVRKKLIFTTLSLQWWRYAWLDGKIKCFVLKKSRDIFAENINIERG